MKNNNAVKNSVEIRLVIEKALEKGQFRQDSGQLIFNGCNYADDIISAVQYVQGLDIYDDEKSLSEVIELIESNIKDYTHIYNDTEGFGQGTIAGIINQIQELNRTCIHQLT